MKMVEHRIKASPAQLKKLMTGGAITLKPANFDASSRHSLMVMPNTSRRIGTAMRKNKGIRIMLKPDEDIMEDEMEGGKISLKKSNRAIRKALTSKKAKQFYREVGKEVLPIAKGVADAGIEMGSQALASYLGNPALASAISGSAKAGLDRGYRALGKEVGLDPNAPVPQFDSPEAVQQYALGRVEANIRGRTKGRVRDAGLAALKGDYATAQELGTDYLIDKKLTGVEQKIARKAKRGEYSNIKDLATDYAAEKLAAATQVVEEPSGVDEYQSLMSGRGMKVRKSRGGVRVGGAMKLAVIKPMVDGGAITGMTSAGYDMRGISPAVAPSSITQLGSPYQRIQSPSMSPFIAASPQLANKAISGGSFLPAGRSGRGFVPAG